MVTSRAPPTGDKTWFTSQACVLTGNLTSDPLVHRLVLNPLSHTIQGSKFFFFWYYFFLWLILERGREKMRERITNVRKRHRLALLYALLPATKPNPLPMHVPWLGIKHVLSVSWQHWPGLSESIFFSRFYLFILDSGEGREKQIERNMNVWLPLGCPLVGTWPTTQACALTGNWTGDSLVRRPALTPLSYTSQPNDSS